MLDNRFLIANLISCSPDTPRVVGDCYVFAIQDRVIDDILGSVREQQAVEAAPRILDPLQQTIITLLRSYLNSPGRQAGRGQGSDAAPTFPDDPRRYRDLRRAYDSFSGTRTSRRSLDMCFQWMLLRPTLGHPDQAPTHRSRGKTCT